MCEKTTKLAPMFLKHIKKYLKNFEISLSYIYYQEKQHKKHTGTWGDLAPKFTS